MTYKTLVVSDQPVEDVVMPMPTRTAPSTFALAQPTTPRAVPPLHKSVSARRKDLIRQHRLPPLHTSRAAWGSDRVSWRRQQDHRNLLAKVRSPECPRRSTVDSEPTWNPEPPRTSNAESQLKPLPANVDAFNKPKTNSKPHQPHIEMLSPTFAGSLRANVPPHGALASAKQLCETCSGQGDEKADE